MCIFRFRWWMDGLILSFSMNPPSNNIHHDCWMFYIDLWSFSNVEHGFGFVFGGIDVPMPLNCNKIGNFAMPIHTWQMDFQFNKHTENLNRRHPFRFPFRDEVFIKIFHEILIIKAALLQEIINCLTFICVLQLQRISSPTEFKHQNVIFYEYVQF